jgi:hypothetical protein
MSSALGAESLSGKTNKRGTMKNGKSDVYGGDKKATAVNPVLSRFRWSSRIWVSLTQKRLGAQW